MVAISFQEQFLDALLRSDKQQTTRPQTERFKVGDVAYIYIAQRRRITDKPEYQLTPMGAVVMQDRYGMTKRQMLLNVFHAHFLGKVEITEVYDVRPSEMTQEELNTWTQADGFKYFNQADVWFASHYDEHWDMMPWTVIRWNGWLERYFEPKNGDNQQ